MSAILDDTHYKGIDPPRGQVQGDFQAKELRLGVFRDQRGVDGPVVGAQGTAGGHEKDLLDPKLGLVLVANGDMGADAQAAPQDADNVDHQKSVGPGFDWQMETGVEKHEGQAARAGKNHAGE